MSKVISSNRFCVMANNRGDHHLGNDKILKAAKRLYNKGFAIHWLKPKSKMPVEAGWTTGPRKKWRYLLDTYQAGMNVGVRLGKPSAVNNKFLGVIDCDVKSEDKKHLKEMKKKLAEIWPSENKNPVTVFSGRGNGSRHIYFLSDIPTVPFRFSQSKYKVKLLMPSAKPSKNDIKELGQKAIDKGYRLRPAWEISVMGDGQQVVLPPSIHPDTNKPYYWGKSANEGNFSQILEFNPKMPKGSDNKRETLDDFKPVLVDLLSLEISDEMVGLIRDGEGSEDRSAEIFKAAMALKSAGLSDRATLSVLTDRENYLGSVGYEHAKTSSRLKAAKWIFKYTLAKAKKEISDEKLFEDAADIVEEPEKLSKKEAKKQTEKLNAEIPWREKIHRNQQDGAPKPSMFNIKLILTEAVNEEQKHPTAFIARNEFAAEDLWLIDTPWGCKANTMVRDEDVVLIKDWLAHKWRFEPAVDRISEVLIKLAIDNSFHPVRDYLDGLEWDGIPRLKTWLKDYLRASGPGVYLKEVGTKTLLAMVSRIYDPGCKFDSVLILEGEQGIGKSSTARILAGEKWFSDSSLNIGDKDSVMNMQGIWVYELGELSVMSRADVNQLKEFVSRSTDKIRPPYGRRTIAFPRQSIFIGTTNSDEYLKDKTGNRRYWPVKCGQVRMKRLRRDRDQLLAEAVFLYRMGEDLWIKNYGVIDVVTKEQQKRVETDEIEFQIAEFLAKPSEDFPIDCFRVTDLMASDVGEGMKNDRQTQMRFGNALRSLGYKKQQKRVNGLKAIWWAK